MNTDSEDTLTSGKLVLSLKTKAVILIYSLQLMFLRIHLFWREDKNNYVFATFGVLIGLIPIPVRTVHILCAFFNLLLFLAPNTFLFYILYGVVVVNTRYAVSLLCLSLYKQSEDFLRQLETLCLLFPCLLKLKYDFGNFIFSIVMLIAAFISSAPPIEIFIARQNDLKPTFSAIKSIIGENNYVLMAQEHKKVLTFNHQWPKIDFLYVMKCINWTIPLFICKIPIILKAWAYISILINLRKFWSANVLLFIILYLNFWVLAAVLIPFGKCFPSSAPDRIQNVLNNIINVISGYVLFLIFNEL